MKGVAPALVPVLAKEGKGQPTIGDIKRAIPEHLFRRSLLRSMGHVALDLLEAAAAVFLVLTFVHTSTSPIVFWGGWALYAFYQGATFTGLWVMAHECGHGGFSDSVLINDVVGYILHTMLFVPYAAWQASHSKHHHYTNNMVKDEPFVPTKLREGEPAPRPNFFATLFNMVIMLTIGWPLYLAINASGPPKTRLVSHYDPSAPFMGAGEGWKIHLGNAGLVAWTAGLYVLGTKISFSMLFALYVVPQLITNMWLVSITYLQHTDAEIPHYDDGEWTWLRGALATVDRSLGPLLDYKLHHIVDSHVCHHMFSSMPFYNAVEATPYIKAALGKYYVQRGSGLTDFLSALWTNVGLCQAVHGKGVLQFVTEADDDVVAPFVVRFGASEAE